MGNHKLNFETERTVFAFPSSHAEFTVVETMSTFYLLNTLPCTPILQREKLSAKQWKSRRMAHGQSLRASLVGLLGEGESVVNSRSACCEGLVQLIVTRASQRARLFGSSTTQEEVMHALTKVPAPGC